MQTINMAKTTLRYLVILTLVSLVIGSSAPEQSPSAAADLICHTENPADCYPKIFQPTKDFETIHDDQDIPPGLHVRMDIYSGKKEARLNIPIEGEMEIDDLPLERTVVVVPQSDAVENDVEEKLAIRDLVPQKPPVYEAIGKITPPREPDGESGESQRFSRAVQSLNGNYIHDPRYKENVEMALETLQDLSHDIYYGVELVKKSDVLQQLVLHMSQGSEDPDARLRRHQAVAIIGHSVQNNPTALKEISLSWKRLMGPTCGKKSVNSLSENTCESEDLVTKLLHSVSRENDPIVAKFQVYAINGLAKDREMRDTFLAKNGMRDLLRIFVKKGQDWDGTRIKIAHFVMDTFLDENMGAQMGIWPQEPEIEDKYCEMEDYATRDGCWKFQLVKMGAQENDAHEWKKELLRLLDEARRGKSRSIPEKEL